MFSPSITSKNKERKTAQELKTVFLTKSINLIAGEVVPKFQGLIMEKSGKRLEFEILDNIRYLCT